jgi:hypothetical protein
MCTNLNYLADALDIVLAWNLPDHLLSSAIADQANLMAGIDHEVEYDDWELSPESFVVFPH